MLNTPLRRLRFVGLAEGLSFLVLLLVAMPLKYFAGMPEAVKVCGSIHGGLFVLFLLCVGEVTIRRPWWSPLFWGSALLAALIPLGPLVFDRWLGRVEEADLKKQPTA
jgi:integral membrane protein